MVVIVTTESGVMTDTMAIMEGYHGSHAHNGDHDTQYTMMHS
jgi:hypothetical protein